MVRARRIRLRGRAVFPPAQSARWVLQFVAGTLGVAVVVRVAAERLGTGWR